MANFEAFLWNFSSSTYPEIGRSAIPSPGNGIHFNLSCKHVYSGLNVVVVNVICMNYKRLALKLSTNEVIDYIMQKMSVEVFLILITDKARVTHVHTCVLCLTLPQPCL